MWRTGRSDNDLIYDFLGGMYPYVQGVKGSSIQGGMRQKPVDSSFNISTISDKLRRPLTIMEPSNGALEFAGKTVWDSHGSMGIVYVCTDCGRGTLPQPISPLLR